MNRTLHLPSKVTIWEVAPRDGFQAEPHWIPTKKKIDIIRQLATTGIKAMEITSFVHPKAVPQLKDAEQVVTSVADLTDITFRALVPNVKGAERALNAGIKKLKLMLSATDAHSIANANCKTEEALQGFSAIVELAGKHRATVSGSISVAFGCPYEGQVSFERIAQIVDRYRQMGINEISLADTTGMANPKQVYLLLGCLKTQFPSVTFSLHLHNTRGMALANVFAALQQGIVHFDSSIAGLGGCPYAPGATGNVATEDLVHALAEMDIETNIDLEQVIKVAKYVQQELGHDGGSYMLSAGPCSQLHEKPRQQKKLQD